MSRIPTLVLVFVLALAACSSTSLPDPVPPPADDDPAPAAVRRLYIGDLSSKVFHRDGCPELEHLDLSKRKLLEHPGDAADEGFAPCKVCQPYRGW
jgi:hypothetical protein